MKRVQIIPRRSLSSLAITTANPLPSGTQGTAYSLTFTCTGGQGGYRWILLHDYSSTGLTLSSGGVLSGTPGVAGLCQLVVAVVDNAGESVQAMFSVTMAPAPGLAITTSSPLPSATVGVAYSATMAATGGNPPYTWAILSDSPDTGSWLSISPGGVLSGTPGTAETESLVIQVTDSISRTVSAPFNLTVSSGSTGFTPQPGYTYTATTIADGQVFTITKTGGGFGTKPVDPRPLLWIDPQATGNINPSPLGRTTTTYENNNLSYSATGGPAGGAWAKGAPVVSGDTGTQKTWTGATDVDQWGAGSQPFNAYGSKYYLYRQKYQNYGAYTDSGNNANIKIFRVWGRDPNTVGAVTEVASDFYMSASNGRPVAEYCNSATPGPDFPRENQGNGTPDQNALNNIYAFSGGPPGTPNAVTFNNWFAEEFITQANLGDPGTNPPTPDNTSLVFNWRVEGLNGNQPAFTLPVNTYQWNQYYINSSVAVALASAFYGHAVSAQMMRYYHWHVTVDGTSGRMMLPIGSLAGFGPTLLDESWCRVHIRNSSTFSAYTITEPQPTSAWSDTSITITLRKGRLGSYSGKALVITDNSGVEHYAGNFT